MNRPVLVIDNYDSFVHNLARYVTLSGPECIVRRNDSISLDDIRAMDPLAIAISPGPCTPREAGISVETVRALGAQIPVFGVCLGHQCIGEAYGFETKTAPEPMHGKASVITHDNTGIFKGLKNPLRVGRYHSLISAPGQNGSKQSPLRINAKTDGGVIMAFQHEAHPVYGVQFHPESVLTEQGLDMVRNFIGIARDFNARKNTSQEAA